MCVRVINTPIAKKEKEKILQKPPCMPYAPFPPRIYKTLILCIRKGKQLLVSFIVNVVGKEATYRDAKQTKNC